MLKHLDLQYYTTRRPRAADTEKQMVEQHKAAGNAAPQDRPEGSEIVFNRHEHFETKVDTIEVRSVMAKVAKAATAEKLDTDLLRHTAAILDRIDVLDAPLMTVSIETLGDAVSLAWRCKPNEAKRFTGHKEWVDHETWIDLCQIVGVVARTLSQNRHKVS